MPRPDDAPSLQSALKDASGLLRSRGVDSPRLSAELLLAAAFAVDRAGLIKRLILEPDALVPASVAARFQALVGRRARGEPAAYLLGGKEFYGRDFAVSPAVLIPRPETELLIDLSLELIGPARQQGGFFADFGTGSGCLAVTLALELPGWRGVALDNSPDALRMAALNRERHAARGLILCRADFSASPLADAGLSLLLSNPPYVSEAAYRGLSAEVRCYEPKTALVPALSAAAAQQSSGTEAAVAVMAEAQRALAPGGVFLMEIGWDQGAVLLEALEGGEWSEAQVHGDLAGLDRAISARRR